MFSQSTHQTAESELSARQLCVRQGGVAAGRVWRCGGGGVQANRGVGCSRYWEDGGRQAGVGGGGLMVKCLQSQVMHFKMA